jgi:hypothetical protein
LGYETCRGPPVGLSALVLNNAGTVALAGLFEVFGVVKFMDFWKYGRMFFQAKPSSPT